MKEESLPAGLPEDTNADWWSSVQAYVERDLRAIEPASDAGVVHRAENAAEGLAFAFPSAGGFSAHALAPMAHSARQPAAKATPVAAEPSWEWGLRPVAVGTRKHMVPLGVRRASETYMETLSNGYDMPWVIPGNQGSGLVEWFANGRWGLRQSFILAARPYGQADAPLLLQLAQVGDLRASLAADGHGLIVRSANGQAVLTYAGLHVFDATGRSLSAHFQLGKDSGMSLVIEILDTPTVYPLVIDPLLGTAASPAWSTAGEGAGDDYGLAAAGAGDVNGDGYADLAVGAQAYGSGQGKVYVFHGSDTGLGGSPAWSITGESTGDWFGNSVAGAGDVNGDGFADLAVGAYGHSSNTGKAYVYLGSASGLGGSPVVPAWSAIGENEDYSFGTPVAGVGDVNGDGYADLAVGAWTYNSWRGKVSVFLGSATGLGGSPAWYAIGENTGSQFGQAVAGAGDVNGDGYADIVIGSPGYSGLGKVYVFHGGATGLSDSAAWSATGELGASSFGQAVAGAGDVNGDGYADLAVGDCGHSSNRGKVYLFLGSAGGLGASPTWNATGENAGDYFGQSLAGAGDVNGDGYADLAVGAYGYSSSKGIVYVFLGSAAGLATSAAWSTTGESAGDSFGFYSVTALGDVNGDGYADLAVGSYAYNSRTGKVYVFHGSADDLAATPTWSAVGENTNAAFGGHVVGAGDVNGDGYADLAVGAFSWGSTGKVYVFHGSATGLGASPAWRAEGETVNDRFGLSLAGAGDVNGDGYSDLAVGASGYSNTGSFGYRGKVYVYYGSATGLAASFAWSATGEYEDDRFGVSIAGVGDVNGDGYADLAVTADGYSNSRTGKAYVFYGNAAGLSGDAASAAWSVEGENEYDWFGSSVAGAGDINGDGYADLVVGASWYSGNKGKAYVFHGSANGLAVSAAWTATGEAGGTLGAGDKFGQNVAGAGDVNGDGYADLAIAAYGYSSSAGKVYVFYGSVDGLSGDAPNPTWSAVGENSSAFFGRSIAGAGDTNGDGYADLAVSAFGLNGMGKVYVFYGSASALDADLAWSTDGENGGNWFGDSVAWVGDVNGDSFAELAVGASDYNSSTGKVYVFHGSGGRPVLAQQLRSDGSTSVQPWGLSYSTSTASVRMQATSPTGRQRVRLEVQACPPGVAFGNAACTTQTSASWDGTPIGAGLTLSTTVTNLTTGTLYRWRARVLYAPYSVTAAGITAPANPPHGPWRRLDGQAATGNIRIDAPLRPLSIGKSGNGSVTSSPAGIDCGNTCSASFHYGTQVSLGATPDAGYDFEKWTENSTPVATNAAYSFTHTADRTLVAVFVTQTPTATPTNTPTPTATPTNTPTVTPTATPVPDGPKAHKDLGATVQDVSLLIDVLANDRPGADPNLSVVAVTQPDSGGTTAMENNQIRFAPELGFTGRTHFSYTIEDGAHLASTSEVDVTVGSAFNVQAPAQTHLLDDPTAGSTASFDTPAGTTQIQVPPGAILNTAPDDTVGLVFLVTGMFPPSDLFLYTCGAFELDLVADGQIQEHYAFAAPIIITVGYDPACVPDPGSLGLFYYDEASSQWTDEGVTVLGVDPAQHTLTASVSHLTKFAIGLHTPITGHMRFPSVLQAAAIWP